MFMGAVSFADDIKLLTPTFNGLKKLVCICEKYAEEYNIMFNCTKSKYMVNKGRNSVVHNEHVYVNGEKVEQVTTADHLGHRLSTTDKTSLITAAVSSFVKSFNLFMANFGHCYLNFLNNTVASFMVHLNGVYIIMNQCVLLEEKY